jgi:hypothetical protein
MEEKYGKHIRAIVGLCEQAAYVDCDGSVIIYSETLDEEINELIEEYISDNIMELIDCYADWTAVADAVREELLSHQAEKYER